MDVLTIIQSVLRRWYIALPILAAAAGAAYYVNSTIPPQFEAQGQVLLAGPDFDPTGLPRTIVDLPEVTGRLTTGDVQREVVADGASLQAVGGPAELAITIRADSQPAAQATLEAATAWVGETISERQTEAEIAPAEQLRLRRTDDQEIEPIEEGGVRVSASFALEDPAAGAPNPFGASNTTGRLLIVAVQSDLGRQRMAERTGGGVVFGVSQDARDAAPILSISTMGSDPQAVLEGFQHVTEVLALELDEREARAEVPQTRRTSIEVLAEPRTVQDVSPPLDRTVAAILGLGGFLALVLALAVESFASRRAIARKPPAVPDEDTQDEPDGDRAAHDADSAGRPRDRRDTDNEQAAKVKKPTPRRSAPARR